MASIAVKCPKCSGTTQFEKEMTSGFCIHCGDRIVTERVAGDSMPNDGTSNIAFYLNKAKETLGEHNWDSAAGLVESILRLDPECRDAWYMKALLHRRSDDERQILEKAKTGKMREYGVFSKADISGFWGEFDLTVSYEISKRTMVNVKTLVVIDGIDSFTLERGKGTIFGVNPGVHEITAQFITKKGLTEGDKMSFIASKDHEFVIKTTSSGMMMAYIEPKIVQIK